MKNKILKIKSLLLALVFSTCSLGLVSCGDDDPIMDLYDVYISCTKVSGGDLSSQDCTQMMSEMNSEVAGYTLKGCTKEEATTFFDSLMEAVAREWTNIKPEKPIYIEFSLKTTEGKTLKKSTIEIRKDKVSIS